MSSLWVSGRRKAKGWHIFIYTLFFSLVLFSLPHVPQPAVNRIPVQTLSKLTPNYHPSGSSPQSRLTTSVPMVLVFCANDNIRYGVSNTRRATRSNIEWNFQRQLDQTVVLLKSIVIQEIFFHVSSPVPVEVLVLTDRFENFHKLDQAIMEGKWPAEFLERIHLTFVPAVYPSGAEWMRQIFRPCATLRLFLDQLLPAYDSVIYVDTDFIFLRPISDLWSEFHYFTTEALVAIAPCLHYYGSKDNLVPFYGKTGLNSGILLMNLTRIRGSNWVLRIPQITKDFLKQLKLGDQDILNIYFNATPSELHHLSCDWNFRPQQCQKNRFCLDTQLGGGISALHGAGSNFVEIGKEPVFHAVFSTIQHYNLTSRSQLKGLMSSLRENVLRVQRNKMVKSRCAHYKAFPTLLFNRINSRAREN